MRYAPLLLGIVFAGCAAPASSYDYDRPFPSRIVDEVHVAGPYGAEDLGAILDAVRSHTAQRVIRVVTPGDIRDQYYRHEIDALPADTAEVWTNAFPAGQHGAGRIYYLRRNDGAWAVRDSSGWIE